MRFIPVALLALILTGCAAGVSSTTVDGVTVLSAPASDAQPEALLEGSLNVDKGCLVVVDAAGVPHGLILAEPAVVTATDGVVTVTVDGVQYGIHDEVSFAGGYGDTSIADCEFNSYFTVNGDQS